MLQFAIEGNINFNSRPREGANLPQSLRQNTRQFQFPPPRGGERVTICIGRHRIKNFNSRPREGANFAILQMRHTDM